eukprot:scaffold500619_cov37-Prasinocladus_malaysianus.AAC.1
MHDLYVCLPGGYEGRSLLWSSDSRNASSDSESQDETARRNRPGLFLIWGLAIHVAAFGLLSTIAVSCHESLFFCRSSERNDGPHPNSMLYEHARRGPNGKPLSAGGALLSKSTSKKTTCAAVE